MSDHEAAAAQSATSSPERPTDATPGSSAKRRRGRPRKYHTDAEREEAKRRYRENHKSKAAGGATDGGGNGTSFQQSSPSPRQHDIDDLWEAIHHLQAEVANLKEQLAQKEAAPPVKRRKV